MIKKHLHKAFSFLLALLLAAGLAVPLVGCTAEDALDLLTAVVENLPEETEAPAQPEAPAKTPPPAETAAPAQTPEETAPASSVIYGVRAPVNSFEFQPCGRTPQVDYLLC